MIRKHLTSLVFLVLLSNLVVADDTDVYSYAAKTVLCDREDSAHANDDQEWQHAAHATSALIPVSYLNPFEYQRSIYYPVFEPSNDAYWVGNIKRYELDVNQQGQQRVRSYVATAGQSEDAIVPCTGSTAKHDECFAHGTDNAHRARSWWNDSAEADGALVAEGGVVSQLPHEGKRNWYLQTAGLKLQQASGHENRDYFAQRKLGAPLHSTPLIVDYGSTQDIEHSVLIVSTNGGFIHLIDVATGKELSAIFPRELLKNVLGYLKKNQGPLLYGMDGQWTVWRHDGNDDGKIDKSSKQDFVYLYGGMRRGGRHLYGFDVTNPARPTMLFDISPDNGSSVSRMGQIWSQPTLAWTRLEGIDKPVAVLLIGGGYDESYDKSYDSSKGPSPDEHSHVKKATGCKAPGVQCGNQVFMVLAEPAAGSYKAGDVVWWSSQSSASDLVNPQMKDSIVGRIRTLDEDGDGYFDRFYAVDIVGRVFAYTFGKKFENVTGGSRTNTIHRKDTRNLTFELLATLGDEGKKSPSSRLFYDDPGLSVGRDRYGFYRLITIGSGWRANPLEENTNDTFFVIKDRGEGMQHFPWKASDFPRLGESFFVDKFALKGFQVPLQRNGEKVFGSSAVLGGKVFFSTYTPPKESRGRCNSEPGDVALYGIDISTGTGVFNNGGEISQASDGAVALRGLSLSSLGKINSNMIGSKIGLLSGSRVVGTLETPKNLVHPMSWHEAARGEAVSRLFPWGVD